MKMSKGFALGAGAMFAVAGSASAIDVVVIDGSFYTNNAATYLATLPGVTVTTMNTYTAASLAPFDFVLHYGNSFFDDTALATYISNGGNLIATPWMVHNNGWHNNAASPIATYTGSAIHSQPLAATVTNAGDPYLAGVAFNNGDLIGLETMLTAKPGATVPVIHTADGSPLLAYMPHGAGMSFYIDLHYITSDTDLAINYGWGKQLLGNIVLVPSPGAGALLVAAGLLAARRRR